MKMINFMIKFPITVFILWIILKEGYTSEQSSFSDNKSNYWSGSEVTSYNDSTSTTEHGHIMMTSTTGSINTALELEILPALTEYTLTSNSPQKNITFTCKGNVPVQWYFEQYDKNVFMMNSQSTNEFSKERNNSIYHSLLSLSSPSYLDTGRYYCATLNLAPYLIRNFENSSVYIFIESKTHLIASPGDYNKWFLVDKNAIFIPCFPTSPNVDVYLTAKISDTHNSNTYETEYNRQYGFIMNHLISPKKLYNCIAKRNGVIERREFTVDQNNLIVIKNEYSEHTIVGQNLKLQCSLNYLRNIYVQDWLILKWKIPKKLKNQVSIFEKVQDIHLNIQNLTFDDDGDIFCELYFKQYNNVWQKSVQSFKLLVKSYNENYLNLHLLNDKKHAVLPAGYHTVKWTIQISSFPKANIEWIGPDNKKLETISERICVNTDDGLSELVIRNLQVSDSGVYKLIANNSYKQEEINITLLVEDLEILPGFAEYTLTNNSTEDNHTIICKGNEPVQWYFEQYDGKIIEKKTSSMKTFLDEQNKHTYVSLLKLNKATYMDTGYYYCALKSINSTFIKDFKHTYIFVQNDIQLFAIPDDINEVHETNLNYIIPCRPSSPDVSIELFLGYTKVTSKFHYDNKKGFIGSYQYANYTCVGQKNNISDHRIFYRKYAISINHGNSDYVISGQNLTLTCTTAISFSNYSLYWFIPDRMKNQSKRVTYDEELWFELESDNIQLIIQNVTIADSGYYVCNLLLRETGFRRNVTYELKVRDPNETHINLRLLNSKSMITRPVGYHSVVWEIEISANPKVVPEWTDSRGNALKTISEKIHLQNDDHLCRLTIKNLELHDSGIYILKAKNTAGQQKINVTLFVEEKPSIVYMNSSNSENFFYVIEKMYIFESLINGYPLPEVEWTFCNCTDYTTVCEKDLIQIQHINTELSSVAQKSFITMIFSESGTLICKASNKFGNVTKQYKVWMTELEISPALTEYTLTSNSPQKNITFTCKGNVPVQWYFEQYDNNIFKKKSQSTREFSKERNSSTYHSLLSLSSPSYLDTGRYYCATLNLEPYLIGKFENSSVYIFIESKTHLIASPGDYNKWFLVDKNAIFIPCFPTSPNVDVYLTVENSDTYDSNTNKTYYDRQYGFITSHLISPENVYNCIAKRNGDIERREFTVDQNNLIVIKNEYSEHIIVGQNLKLSCSFNFMCEFDIQDTIFLSWKIPKKLKNQDRVEFHIKKYSGTGIMGIPLEIKNLTFNDDGDIFCELYFKQYNNVWQKSVQSFKLLVKSYNENYLYLQLLNDKNHTVLPAGYHTVKWTVQISSFPKANIEWIGPDNKKLETISERICVNTKKKSSELVIRNLQVSDSGIYKLIANNSYKHEEINITLLVEDLEILPGFAEYTLTKNSTEDNHTITCKGYEPVQWYFEQYDGNIIEKKTSSMKTFLDEQNKHTYVSLLKLNKATYMDTGYYYCALKSINSTFIKDFKHTYIFVQNDTQLFAIPDDINEVHETNLNYIIPCRPSSPDVSIELFLGDKKVTSKFHYDNKKGFIGSYQYANYTCVGQKNNISDHRKFYTKVVISIKNGNSDYVISGQNLTLTCTTAIIPLKRYTLSWLIPDKINNQSKRITYDEEQFFDMESGNIQLSIQNVTIADGGTYECNLLEGKSNDLTAYTYELKVHASNESHLILRILNHRNMITRPVGYHSVDWEIEISAHPKAILEWRGPGGNTLKTISEKIHLQNDDHLSQLTIKNLESHDSGVYILKAKNAAGQQEINVTLFVEDKTSIVCLNNSYSEDLYCEKGKMCIFEFLINGYPLPEFTWTFTNCIDYTTVCEEDLIQKELINIEFLSSIAQKSSITMTFTESGTLICKASNKFGNVTKHYKVWMTETSSPILYILLIPLAVIVFGSVLWFIKKRILKQKVAAYLKKEFEMGAIKSWNQNLEHREQAHLLPYDSRWEFSLDKIKIGKQIGSGAFGIVYKAKAIGMIDDNTTFTVAVKTVKPTADASHAMALASELKIMANIGRHLNIVNLLGACTADISKKLMVIVEYCCFGSIDRYMQQHIHCFINQITPDGLIGRVDTVSKIHSYEHFPFKPSYSETLDVTYPLLTSDGHPDANFVEFGKRDTQHGAYKQVNNKPLCTNDLLSWSYQVSKGMDYLASRKILHRDLASRNILLTEGNVVKICDFGLAKNMYKSDFYTYKKGLLPIKWLAIESMRYGIFSTASDVWSFGVVLWEIFSLAAIPYPNVQSNDLLDSLIQGYRMEQPAYSNSKIYDIMLDCWREEPTERPSFSDLAKRIGDFLLESTKAEYAELNDHHMKMYENLPSSDLLDILTAKTHTNNSEIANDAIQSTETRRRNSESFNG